MQAGRSVLIADCGSPPPPGVDRYAHAGTLSMELSIGRDRMIVNCGAMPGGGQEWRDAGRATAAHSTLVIADMNSSELRPDGLGQAAGEGRSAAAGGEWRALAGGEPRRLEEDVRRHPSPPPLPRRERRGRAWRGRRGGAAPQPFTLRFHLHPAVKANMQQDGEAVLLRLPAGGGWRLRAEGARMSLEESIYLGGAEPRRSEQVVLPATRMVRSR